MQAMAARDNLKKEKRFPEYKKLRNKIKNMMRRAKKYYFQKLIEHEKNISSAVWRGPNAFTKGCRSTVTEIPQI